MLRKALLASVIALGAATPALAQSEADWTGPYLGVSVGIAGDQMSYPFSATFTPTTGMDSVTTAAAAVPGTPNTVAGQAKLNSSGIVGGVLAGYDVQVGNNVVLGVVADIAATSTKGAVSLAAGSSFAILNGTADATIGSKLKYVGTVRARAGVPIAGGRFMPYVTGGFVYGKVDSYAVLNFSGAAGGLGGGAGNLGIGRKTNHGGWTAGGGAEYAVTDQLHFGVEYLYADLGRKQIIGGGIGTGGIGEDLGFGGTVSGSLNVKPTLHIMRATATYRF